MAKLVKKAYLETLTNIGCREISVENCVSDITGANFKKISLLNLSKSQREVLHQKIIEFLEKGYVLLVQKSSELNPNSKARELSFGIVTCKKLRVGETIHNLVAVFNPSRQSFGENPWAPGGSR